MLIHDINEFYAFISKSNNKAFEVRAISERVWLPRITGTLEKLPADQIHVSPMPMGQLARVEITADLVPPKLRKEELPGPTWSGRCAKKAACTATYAFPTTASETAKQMPGSTIFVLCSIPGFTEVNLCRPN
jgi:hypothetical protein